MYNPYFIRIIAVWTYFIYCEIILSCITQDDCQGGSLPGRPPCSYCVDDSSTNATGHCIYPFDYYYMNTETKCELDLMCATKICAGSSYCVASLHWVGNKLRGAYPYCICTKPFYGYQCELTNYERSEVSLVSFEYAEYFPGHYEEVDIVLGVNQDEEDLYGKAQISIRTEGEFSETYLASPCKYPYCRLGGWYKWRDTQTQQSYKVKIRFPFKPFETTDSSFLKLRNEIEGYLSNVSLTVTVDGHIDYHNDFRVLVKYSESDRYSLKCISVIKLNQCGPSAQKARLLTRLDRFEITSSANFWGDGRFIDTSEQHTSCTASISRNWKIWKMDKKHTPFSLPVVEDYRNKTLLTNPFKLDVGEYKVAQEVKYVDIDGVSMSYGNCYFNIFRLPLVARVKGGSEFKIYKETGLILISNSYDPNMPRSEQDHLQIEWSCEDLQTPGSSRLVCAARTMEASAMHRIPPKHLRYGASYNFTLKVFIKNTDFNASTYVLVRVADKNEKYYRRSEFFIECVQNCGDKVIPDRVLILRVSVNPYLFGSTFVWTYHMPNGHEESGDLIIDEPPSPPHMFIIKNDGLKRGEQYIIVARDISTGWTANYTFETDNTGYEGNCSVTPQNETKRSTLFQIECTAYSFFTYEFYDKSDDDLKSELIFNGRMLGTSHTGFIKDVRLTRGNVCVHIYNRYGLSVVKILKVNITIEKYHHNELNTIIHGVEDKITNWDLRRVLSYISSVSDSLHYDEDNKGILVSLLTSYKSLQIPGTIEGIKQWTASVSNVLSSLNKQTYFGLDPGLIADLLSDVNRLVKGVNHNMGYKCESNQWVSPQHLGDIARRLLDCLYTLINRMDTKYIGVVEETIDLGVLNQLRRGSDEAVEAFEGLEDVVSMVQASGQHPNNISTSEQDIVVWVIRGDEVNTISRSLENNENIPVSISHDLLTGLERQLRSGEELILKVAKIKQNLFSWQKSNVRSTLTSVSLSRQMQYRYMTQIEQIDKPMIIRVLVKNDSSCTIPYEGTVRLDPKAEIEGLDLSVRIHRFELEARTLTIIQFQSRDTKHNIRVLALKNLRPDYEMMISEPHKKMKFEPLEILDVQDRQQIKMNKVMHMDDNPFAISQSITVKGDKPDSGTFKVTVGDNPTLLYLGIIPDVNVPSNKTVGYSFTATSVICKVWIKGVWSSGGCRISNYTKGEDVSCLCDHFSIFSAAFPIPPERIDPFSDIRLFLTIVDNPLVVTIVVVLLLVFLLCCVVVKTSDQRNKHLLKVIMLNDNYPKDAYPLLVAVYTGTRFNAGTTAHVCVTIHGEFERSRSHVLSCKTQSTLQTNSDDWFIMLCSSHLGKLESLHIWHDNAGHNPDWFCDKIFVYDLIAQTETRFIFEQWLSLKQTDYPEATALPAKMHDLKSFKRDFLENLVIGFREEHVALSVVYKHPRSEITKLQRNCMLMCSILVVMLCSIMFYKITQGESMEDDFQYTMAMRDFIISVESLAISLLFSTVIKALFRMSYKYTYSSAARSTLEVRNSNDDIEYAKIMQLRKQSNTSVTKFTFEENTNNDKYARIISKTFKTRKLTPVHLTLEPVVKTRITFYIAAWMVSSGIIISCVYMIMLYGLKVGEARSRKWITTVVFSMLQEFMVMAPIRIVLMAILVSIACRKMFDVNNHIIDAKQVLKMHLPSDSEQYKNILRERSKPRYAPLTIELRSVMLEKHLVQSHWMSLGDFAVAVCFVVILHGVVFGMFTSSYYKNYHITRLLTTGHRPDLGTINFKEVTNFPTTDTFLDSTFIQSMYALRWYNNKELGNDNDKKYWASDLTNRMLGLPTLRQVRVVPSPCENLIGVQGLCTGPWRHLLMDTDDYDYGWTAASYSTEQRTSSPWKFSNRTKPSTVTMYRLRGLSGHVYDDSGYITTLGPTLRRAELTLAELCRGHWLARLTKAVFLESTLFNANLNQFSQVTLLVEYLLQGAALTKAQTRTIVSNSIYNVNHLLLCMFVLYYLVSCGYFINREGLLEHLSESANVLRLAIGILGSLIIILLFTHSYQSNRFTEVFQRKGKEDSFDFDYLMFFFQLIFFTLVALNFIALIRVILLLRVGKKIVVQLYALKLAGHCIFFLALVYYLTFLVLYMQSFLMNIFFFKGFTNILIKKKINASESCSDQFGNIMQVLIICKHLSTEVLTGLFIVMFNYYIKLSKSYSSKIKSDFNFITFVCDRLKNWFKKNTI